MKRTIFIIVSYILILWILVSCATQKKLSSLESGALAAHIAISKDTNNIVPELYVREQKRDTLEVINFDGREVLLMKAIRDDKTGEMVANDVLDAAVVTARFRNVAERHGKVDIAFEIIVPESMQDSRWQLRFYPELFVLEDSIRLDPVIITGNAYRKAQLKGYQQYERFLSKIVSDTTTFINLRQLELFLKRNIPQLYAFKTDSSEVSDEVFESCFGVNEQQAIDHYTNRYARNINNRRKARIGQMYQKYVRAPIVTDGIRLDTVMVDINGDFVYNYIQTINTRPKLRRADIILSGAIFEQDKQIFTVPRSEPLTFYISSISAFTDARERYLMQVIERKVMANTECPIVFEAGKADIRQDLGDNDYEIRRIQQILSSLLVNEEFDLDSIVIAATASPEGTYASNTVLAQKRSEFVSSLFSNYMKHYNDSLSKERGITINVDDTWRSPNKKVPQIKFATRSIPENWDGLVDEVLRDTVMIDSQKDRFNELMSIKDPDEREDNMRKESWYEHIRDAIYPKLRTVKFNFYLHRQGMIQDTVHTTILDTTYMRGIQALKDMDYDIALSCLHPYNDFNTAVAYVGLDRNQSALEILTELERTAEVNYLLAIIYARQGNEQQAVTNYMEACRQNRSYINRGNLDPEISTLIKTYGLNQLFE